MKAFSCKSKRISMRILKKMMRVIERTIRFKQSIDIIQEFRKYFEELVKKNSKSENSNFKLSLQIEDNESQELEEKINALSKLVDAAWRGQNVSTEDLKKVFLFFLNLFKDLVSSNAWNQTFKKDFYCFCATISAMREVCLNRKWVHKHNKNSCSFPICCKFIDSHLL